MYRLSFTPRFDRDVKRCGRRHWNMTALKQAVTALSRRDDVPLGPRYRDHQLAGDLRDYRAIHVDSAPNPARGQWVLMYRIAGDELLLVRTGTHEEVYGR